MLHEAKNAGFVVSRSLLGRRLRFVGGTIACERSLSRRAHAGLARLEANRPVAVAALADGHRRYWWFRGRFWWEEEGLEAEDVMALVFDRELRRERAWTGRRRGWRRRTGGGGVAGRPGIRLEVKRAVWARCGGRCVECGGDSRRRQHARVRPCDPAGHGRVRRRAQPSAPLRLVQPQQGGVAVD